MPLHRPSFMVSKTEATRKLLNAIKNGNSNSIKRQLNRGANITSANVANALKNYTMKKNIRKLLESRGAPKISPILPTLTARINEIPIRRRTQEEIENAKYYHLQREEQKARQKEKEERNKQKKLIANYQKQQEKMRTIALARKRISNQNAAMTYKNGKPEGLKIKIPKNRTRRVHYYNNTLPVK